MRVDDIGRTARAATGENGNSAGSLGRALIVSGARRVAPPRRDGQSASPPGSGEVDPLAELARLIEQDQAFGPVVRRSRSQPGVETSRCTGEPSSSHFSRDDDPYAHDRDGDTGAPLVPSFLCDGPTDDPHDSHEHGGDDRPDYSNGLPSQRRALPMLAALLGLALAGCASAMAYWAWSDGRVRSNDAPAIAISISPDKVTPAPQGENSQADEQSVNAMAPSTAGEEKPAEPAPAAAPQTVPPTGVLYGPAPGKIAALTPGPAPTSSPADPVQNQPPEVKEPAPSETAPGATAPGATAPGATAPGEAAPGATAPGATEPGGTQDLRYIVQLSSQRSEAAAQATSRTLQTKYPDVFGGRPPFIRRSDLGDRGVYYRVLTGPFAIGEAKQICGNLKKSGADCVVQKN